MEKNQNATHLADAIKNSDVEMQLNERKARRKNKCGKSKVRKREREKARSEAAERRVEGYLEYFFTY